MLYIIFGFCSIQKHESWIEAAGNTLGIGNSGSDAMTIALGVISICTGILFLIEFLYVVKTSRK